MNKYYHYHQLAITLLLVSVAFAQNMQNSNSSLISIGGGLRDPMGLGFEYQHTVREHISGVASLGFFPVDGFHAAFGACYRWRESDRIRPVVLTSISYNTGLRYSDGNMSLNGTRSAFITHGGLYLHLYGGVQIVLVKNIGLQYVLGWRQEFIGGGYRIISSSDPVNTANALDGVTGSGLTLGARVFWEL
jgi:hypothetical protein